MDLYQFNKLLTLDDLKQLDPVKNFTANKIADVVGPIIKESYIIRTTRTFGIKFYHYENDNRIWRMEEEYDSWSWQKCHDIVKEMVKEILGLSLDKLDPLDRNKLHWKFNKLDANEYSDVPGNLNVGSLNTITSTEIGYLNGLTSSIQTLFDWKFTGILVL